MKVTRLLGSVTVAAQIAFSIGAASATKAQAPSTRASDLARPNTPAPVLQVRRQDDLGSQAAQSVRKAADEDILSGVTLSEEQHMQIDQIHKDMRSRMEQVARDSRETPDQKEAMIRGLQRMERHQVFMALTPAQRSTLTKRLMAQRAAALQKGQSQPLSPK